MKNKHMKVYIKGNSLAVQELGLQASTAEVPGLIPKTLQVTGCYQKWIK